MRAQPTVAGPAYAGYWAWDKDPAPGGGWGSSALSPVSPLAGERGGGGQCCPSAHRLHKCRLCYKQLKSISGLVRSKSGLSGRHGSAFRELHLLMASLD